MISSSGLIFNASWHRSSGSVRLDLPEPAFPYRARYQVRQARKPVATPLRIISTVALALGAGGLVLTMLPVVAMELQYRLNQAPGTRHQVQLSDSDLPLVTTPMPTPTAEPTPASAEEIFSVRIPKIEAESIVVPNVDAGDPKAYMKALQKGVAHAAGTGLPGVDSSINRTIYLFAHSTSAPSLVRFYNAQFYLLHKLEPGDEIEVTFWRKQYRYRVTEKRIVPPSDVSFLTPQTEKEMLVLATCTPPGTTLNRLLVIAEPMGDMLAP